MLRNDLITLLAQYDNDPVVVSINGCPVGVEGVAVENGSIAIVLSSDELRAAVSTQASAAGTITTILMSRPEQPESGTRSVP